MTNEEHLELAKKQDKDFIELAKKEKEFYKEHGYGIYDYPSKAKEKKLELMSAEYRRIKALEIIAETLMDIDNDLQSIDTDLENIETILNRR